MSDEESRPKPRYGELAPEGWEWKPEGAEDSSASGEGSGNTESPANVGTAATATPSGSGPEQRREPGANESQPTNRGTPQVPPFTGSGDGSRVPGVPHNLGVGTPIPAHRAMAAPQQQPQQQQQPGQQQQPRQDGTASSYRAAAPPQYAPQAPRQTGNGDRIATIILLVVATLGALYSAMSMMLLPSSFNLIASIVEFDGFTVPSSVQTLGTVGALIILALYALMLIFSIQRLRAKKLAFWIPLAAGVLAIIVIIAITFIAISQMPELLEVLSDPDLAARLLDPNALLNQ